MALLESPSRDPSSKRSKNNELKFTSYITSFLKRHNPNFGLTAEASECIDLLIKITIGKIIKIMNLLLVTTDKKTVSQRDIHHAMRLTFKHPLFCSSAVYASKAVETYKNKVGAPSPLIATRSEKAGLVLPVTRIEKIFMDNLKKPNRKTDTLAVYLVGAIENVVLELYKGAGREVSQVKKHRLSPLFITKAIRNNPSLSELYGDCILMCDTSGSLPKPPKKKSPKTPPVLVLELQESPTKKAKAKPKAKPKAKAKPKTKAKAKPKAKPKPKAKKR